MSLGLVDMVQTIVSRRLGGWGVGIFPMKYFPPYQQTRLEMVTGMTDPPHKSPGCEVCS